MAELKPLQDLQYRATLNSNSFFIVEGVLEEDMASDAFSYEDTYAVYSDTIDLADYSEAEIEEAVSAYYPSLEVMRESMRDVDQLTFNGILAECLFDNGLTQEKCHGFFTYDTAVDLISNMVEEFNREDELELD